MSVFTITGAGAGMGGGGVLLERPAAAGHCLLAGGEVAERLGPVLSPGAAHRYGHHHSTLELQTKVIRRFSKISQSRRERS